METPRAIGSSMSSMRGFPRGLGFMRVRSGEDSTCNVDRSGSWVMLVEVIAVHSDTSIRQTSMRFSPCYGLQHEA
jgi:hypothetical protein